MHARTSTARCHSLRYQVFKPPATIEVPALHQTDAQRALQACAAPAGPAQQPHNKKGVVWKDFLRNEQSMQSNAQRGTDAQEGSNLKSAMAQSAHIHNFPKPKVATAHTHLHTHKFCVSCDAFT